MATMSDWNFFNRNVQSGMLEGRFMNAAFTLVAAGPPRLAAAGVDVESGELTELGNIAYPIGVLQSINLGQNSNIVRLWEIGSMRSYFARGRTMGQVGLGRIMYHGPSLLRVMYAYLGGRLDTGEEFLALYENSAKAKLNTSGEEGGKQVYRLPPGYENLWLDLASDVFDQPIGLLVYMRDSNEDTIGAFYLEYCMIANHGWMADASGTIMSENVGVMYERIIPIDIRAVELIRSSEDVESIVGANVIGSAA